MTTIPARNLPILQDEIAKLNRRAAKLGVTPVSLTVGEPIIKHRKDQVTGLEWDETFYACEVAGETPKLAGWHLVAAITPQESGENLVRTVPGLACPPQYRTADPTQCDHCHTHRRRRDVFVLEHDDGRTVQIGRQCLADFLGGVSPEALLSQAEWAWKVEGLLSDAERDDYSYGGGGRQRPEVAIGQYIAAAALCIRKLGWKSRSSHDDFTGGRASADDAWQLCMPPTWIPEAFREWQRWVDHNNLRVDDKDNAFAADALAWGRALPTNGSDYLYNLGVACRLECVTPKTMGLVASLVTAYKRHLDEQVERPVREEKNRGHVGTVGERQGFADLTITAMRSLEGQFGVTTLCRFEDAAGNILVWFASGEADWVADAFEKGETVSITGTVKTHSDYKGTPQTVLGRVSKGMPKAKRTKKTATAVGQ